MPITHEEKTLEQRLREYVVTLKQRLAESRKEVFGFEDGGAYDSGKETAIESVIEELEAILSLSK